MIKKNNCCLSSSHKRPKTPALDAAKGGRSVGANLYHVDRYLFENFRSLYKRKDDDDDNDGICRAFYIKEPVDFSPRFTEPPPEVIRASKRFFTSPIIASSLVEEARLSAASCNSTLPSDSATTAAVASRNEISTAVVMFSDEPYYDFRQSMLEMVEARYVHASTTEALDWDFMEELLFCYLELNDRSVHEHIFRAFADLTAAFRSMQR